MSDRVTQLDNLSLFSSGPAEFLVANLADQIALVSQFAAVFGPNIVGYQRMDFSQRDLPALRIYNTTFQKEFESWFINGEIVLDVILPPSTRRELLQRYQDTITSALCQQFRRPTFFETMCGLVPGLNELGKEFMADKSLGFQLGENLVPLTQIRANFRLDLRVWDEYLVSQNRTKDDPFEETLADMEIINTFIKAYDDEDNLQVTVESLQELT